MHALNGMLLNVILASAVVEVPFKIKSEVIRDRDSGRIRGIRSRNNKSFVLGGLFPVHLQSSTSNNAPCGMLRLRGPFRVEAMLFAIDKINADPDLLPGVELGYDIRENCLSETVGLDEAIDLIFSGTDFDQAICKAAPDATTNGVSKAAAVPLSGIVGASFSRVSVPLVSLGRLFQMPQVSYASTSPLLSDFTKYSILSSHVFFRQLTGSGNC